MGALGHYLEAAGIATTQISLIREHTAAIRPPRALWVPFILGRPFGVPHDREFQKRVLLAALGLFDLSAGPALIDYDEDAPSNDSDPSGMACPVSFAGSMNDIDLGATFIQEVIELRPWHDLARQRRGRTSIGLSDIGIDAAANRLAALLDSANVDPLPGLDVGQSAKVMLEDIRTYYYEAAAARPGTPDAVSIQNWFWTRTAAGKVFLKLHDVFSRSEHPSLQQLCATSLVPKAISMNNDPVKPI